MGYNALEETETHTGCEMEPDCDEPQRQPLHLRTRGNNTYMLNLSEANIQTEYGQNLS